MSLYHFDPDDNPDHDPDDPRCGCLDCLAIADDIAAEELAEFWRDSL